MKNFGFTRTEKPPASRISHSLRQLRFCFNVGTKFHPHLHWRPFPLVVLTSTTPVSWELGVKNQIYPWNISLQTWSLFVRAKSRSLNLIRIMNSSRLKKIFKIIESILQPTSGWRFYCLLLSWKGKNSRNTEIKWDFSRRLKGFWALQVSRRKITNDETDLCREESLRAFKTCYWFAFFPPVHKIDLERGEKSGF